VPDLRGRLAGEYPRLRDAAGRAEVGSEVWCAAQFWLGQTASRYGDLAQALGHFTAVCDAIGDRGPSRALAECLGGRSVALANLGRVAEAIDEGHRSLAMAREVGYPAAEALALVDLSIAAAYAGDAEGSVRLARQAVQVPADIPGRVARVCRGTLAFALTAAGDLAGAESTCAEALARSRVAGDLRNQEALVTQMADLGVRAGRLDDAAAHLREGLQICIRAGGGTELVNVMEGCAYLCAAAGRHAEAVTAWAAMEALSRSRHEEIVEVETVPRRRELLRAARLALGPDRTRTAEERGTAMSAATAVEYVLPLTSPAQRPVGALLGQLSSREQELVTLVARGRTDAQIAAELFISVRTVSSHLDRIRDKTGCRRRADLTRLALAAGLV
jgi:DNA-binding CsgD family transcriptional regulator/tetratricopeptide (TPR) repeat protein